MADNAGSAWELEKLGMQREAHVREHHWYGGGWWDVLICVMLEWEWQRA